MRRSLGIAVVGFLAGLVLSALFLQGRAGKLGLEAPPAPGGPGARVCALEAAVAPLIQGADGAASNQLCEDSGVSTGGASSAGASALSGFGSWFGPQRVTWMSHLSSFSRPLVLVDGSPLVVS